MKKRLLSLLLVLCMVLPMVPVGAIIAAAADAPAVTLYDADGGVFATLSGQRGDMVKLPAFTGTPDGKTFVGWDMTGDGKADHNDGATVIIPSRALELVPVFEEKVVIEEQPFVAGKVPFAGNEPVVSGGTVTWRAGWQVGFYNGNTFTPYKAQSGGINLHNGDAWGGQGGMYNAGSSYKIAMTKAPNYSTILYTMPFTGTVELGYDKLVSRRETNPSDVAATVALDVAIYVNNVKVWPTDAEWYHYEGTTVYPAGQNEHNEDALAYMMEKGMLMLMVWLLPLPLTVAM
ncbi:MAG: hypothetical protein IJY20_00805 [Clostridia bacterium]|nr:hypothetical protein [Clostridia bacterium]